MRTFKVIVALLLYSTIAFAQSGWFWQNPLPQGNDLYCVKYVNSTTAFAGGSCGSVLKTTDNGVNWKIIKTDSSFIVTSMHFQNPNTGYVICTTDLTHGYYFKKCKIGKTTDGGNSWTSKVILDSGVTYSIEFTSQNTGYFSSKDFHNNGYIYKTTNAGENWFTILTQNNGNYIYNTNFQNDYTGFACGSMGIKKTTDGGVSWESKFQLTSSGGINSLKFLNSTTGIAVGYRFYSFPPSSSQLILKTTNSGSNWIEIVATGTNGLIDINYQASGGVLFSLGVSSLIKSTNEGNNWSSVILNGSSNNAFDFYGQNGMIIGTYGTVLNTINNGESWNNYFPSFTGSYINCIKFLNKNTGYATAQFNILKTTNSGSNWVSINTPALRTLNSLCIVDSNTIYAVGGNSEPNSSIIKTTNGGLNWEIQLPGNFFYFLNSVFFINNNTGYICGHSVVIKTTNGGINWNSTTVGSSVNYSIYFVNNDTGYVTGYDAGYKTTDGGITWNTNIIGAANSVYFVNNNIGFTTYIPMKIRKTTDGGVSWYTKTQGDGWYLNSINFVNQATGFAVGNLGAILKTTDAGETWVRQNSLTNNSLNSVYMTDTNECYVAGENNTILKTTTGGTPVIGITSLSNAIPNKYFIYQNYPNPFNPVTKINFDISKLSIVKIKVYDLLGKEVSILINEMLHPGSYSAEWNGANYPSGIYFYTLETNDYKETKKMILLK